MTKNKKWLMSITTVVFFISVLFLVLSFSILKPELTTKNQSENIAEAAVEWDGSNAEFVPGKVAAGYQPVSGSSGISNQQGLINLRPTGTQTGNYHLTQNITMETNFAPLWGNNTSLGSGKDFWGDRYFDGILDGCGYTISFPYSSFTGWARTIKSDTWFMGLLFGIVRGTVKNVNIVVSGTGYFAHNSATEGRFGIIAGALQSSGVIDNCTVTLTQNTDFQLHTENNNTLMYGGFVGEAKENSVIRNSKFTVESGVTFRSNNNNGGSGKWTSVGGFMGAFDSASADLTVLQNCTLSGSGTIEGNVNNGSADALVGGAIGRLRGSGGSIVNNFFYDFTGQIYTKEDGNRYDPNGHRIVDWNGKANNIFYRDDISTTDSVSSSGIWGNGQTTRLVKIRRGAYYNNHNSVTTNVNTARIDGVFFHKTNYNDMYVSTYYNATIDANSYVVGQICNSSTGTLYAPSAPGNINGLIMLGTATNKRHYSLCNVNWFTQGNDMSVIFRQGKYGHIGDKGQSGKSYVFDGAQKTSNVMTYLTANLTIDNGSGTSYENSNVNVASHGAGSWEGRPNTKRGLDSSIEIRTDANVLVYQSWNDTTSNGGMLKPGSYIAKLRPGTEMVNLGLTAMALNNVSTGDVLNSSQPIILARYSSTYSISFTITKKDVGVLAPSGVGHIYGASPASVTPTYTGLIGGYDLTGSLGCAVTLNAATPVGSYAITLGTITDPNNVYNLTFTAQNYVVSARDLVLSDAQVVAKTKIYGSTDDLLDTINTGYNGDTLKIRYTRVSGENVGTYNYSSVSKNEANNNYGNISIGGDSGNNKFTITPKEIGITWGNSSFTFNGNNQAPTATATGLVGTDSCSITVTGAEREYNVNSYTATASAISNSNYKLPIANTQPFTIAKYNVSITPDLIKKIYGETDNLNKTVETGISSESISVTYTRASGENVGLYDITAVSLAVAANNYTCSLANGTSKFEIEKKEAFLSWGSATFIYNGNNQAPTASVSNLLGSDTCTVTVTGAQRDYSSATYTAAASALSNANYKLPSSNTTTFTINKYNVVINPTLITKVYGDGDNLNKTENTGIAGETINVTYARESGETVRVYDIIGVALSVIANNYSVTLGDGIGKFEITQKVAVLSWSNSVFTYNGNAQKPTATVTNLVGSDSCVVTVVGEQRHGGNHTATATTLSNLNYSMPENVAQPFVINKFNVVVSPSLITFIYGSKLELTQVVNTGINAESISVKYTKTSGDDVGFYDITSVDLSAPSTDYTCTLASGSGANKVEIVKREIIISWSNTELVYNGQVQKPVATVANLVSGDTCVITVTTNPTDTVNASTSPYVAQATAIDNANYKLPSSTTTGYTIAKYNVEINPTLIFKTYGSADILYEIIETGVNNESITVRYTRTEGENVGFYHLISVSNPGFSNFTSSIMPAAGNNKFEIKAKNISISAKPFTKVYGETTPIFEETFNTGVGSESVVLVYTLESTATDNVGEYSFESVAQKVPNLNYTVSFVEAGGINRYTITKASLKVTAGTYEKIYGDADPDFKQTVKGAKNEDIVIIFTRPTGNNYQVANTYSFTGIDYSDNNHEITFAVNGGLNKFTISPRALSVTASTFTKIYGNADPGFTETFTGYYSKPYTLTYKRETGPSYNDVGTYSFNQVLVSDSSYTVSFALDGGKDKFTIEKRAVEINAPNYQKTFGDADPEFTDTRSGYHGTSYTITYNRDTTSAGANEAGSYNFISLSTTSGNYTLTFAEGGNINKFTIIPKALNVVANDFSKSFGDTDPVFEQNISGVGETLVVVFACSLEGNVEQVGKYSFISVTLKVPNGNYTVSFAEYGGFEKFTITRKSIEDSDISVTGVVSKVYSGLTHSQNFEVFWGVNKITDYSVSYVTGYNVNVSTGGRFTITGTGNFMGVRTVDYAITPLAIETLAFGTVSDTTYTGSEITPSASVTFNSSLLTKDADYQETYLNNINAGVATLVVTGIGNFGSSKHILFNIEKATITYSWTSTSAYTYNRLPQGKTIEVSGLKGIHTQAAGFTVTYTGTTYAGDTYNSNVLPTMAAETYTATVSVTGGDEYTNNYVIPSNVSSQFSIAKANIAGVFFLGTTAVYNGTTRYLNVSNLNQAMVSNSATTEIGIVPANATNNTGDIATITYQNNGITGVSLNGTSITATLVSVNYNDRVMTASLIGIKANSVINTAGVVLDYQYTGAEQIVDTGATLNHSETMLVYTNNTFTNVPTSKKLEITISASETDHYNSASVVVTINIAKAVYNVDSITFVDVITTYDGTAKTVVITGTLPSGLTSNYTNNTHTNAGIYTATVAFQGDYVNYEFVPNKTATLTINKANYDVTSISLNDKTVDYNGTAQSITIAGSLPTGLTVLYVNNNQFNAGTYTVIANFNGDYANYNEVDRMQATLVINKISYDMSGISFENQTKVYNKQAQFARITGDLPVGLDGIAVSVSYAGSVVNVGSGPINARFTSTSINYTLPYSELSATLTIIPKMLTVTPSNTYYTIKYSVSSINLTTNHYNVEGIIEGDSALVQYSATFESTEVGPTKIYMTLTGTDNSNYSVGDGTIVVVLQAEILDGITVTFIGTSFVYTNAPISPEIAVRAGDVVIEDYSVVYYDFNAAISLNTAPINVGNYRVTVTYEENNETHSKHQLFDITKANVEIVLDNPAPQTYGRFARHTATAYGVSGETIESHIPAAYSYLGRRPSVGTHIATVTFNGNNNYEESTQEIEFEILPLQTTITVVGGGTTIEYDGLLHTFTFRYSDLAQGDDSFARVDFGNGVRSKKEAGTYEGQILLDNSNYEVIEIKGSRVLEIKKKELHVSVIATNEALENKEIKWQITYEGFVEGENISAFTRAPYMEKSTYAKGQHIVKAIGGVASNYQFVYEPYTLRVFIEQLTATVSDKTSSVKVAGSFAPEANVVMTDLKGEVGSSAAFELNNQVLIAYKIEVKDDEKKQTYKINFANGTIRNNILTNAYFVTNSGNKISIPRSQISKDNISFVTEESGRLVVYRNYTIIYVAASIVIVAVVAFLIVRIKRRAAAVSASERYKWL